MRLQRKIKKFLLLLPVVTVLFLRLQNFAAAGWALQMDDVESMLAAWKALEERADALGLPVARQADSGAALSDNSAP